MADIYYNSRSRSRQRLSQIARRGEQPEDPAGRYGRRLQQLKESWDGQAKDAYIRPRRRSGMKFMDNIIDILSRVATSVSEARQSAGATDARNAGGFLADVA